MAPVTGSKSPGRTDSTSAETDISAPPSATRFFDLKENNSVTLVVQVIPDEESALPDMLSFAQMGNIFRG